MRARLEESPIESPRRKVFREEDIESSLPPDTYVTSWEDERPPDKVHPKFRVADVSLSPKGIYGCVSDGIAQRTGHPVGTVSYLKIATPPDPQPHHQTCNEEIDLEYSRLAKLLDKPEDEFIPTHTSGEDELPPDPEPHHQTRDEEIDLESPTSRHVRSPLISDESAKLMGKPEDEFIPTYTSDEDELPPDPEPHHQTRDEEIDLENLVTRYVQSPLIFEELAKLPGKPKDEIISTLTSWEAELLLEAEPHHQTRDEEIGLEYLVTRYVQSPLIPEELAKLLDKPKDEIIPTVADFYWNSVFDVAGDSLKAHLKDGTVVLLETVTGDLIGAWIVEQLLGGRQTVHPSGNLDTAEARNLLEGLEDKAKSLFDHKEWDHLRAEFLRGNPTYEILVRYLRAEYLRGYKDGYTHCLRRTKSKFHSFIANVGNAVENMLQKFSIGLVVNGISVLLGISPIGQVVFSKMLDSFMNWIRSHKDWQEPVWSTYKGDPEMQATRSYQLGYARGGAACCHELLTLFSES